MEIRKKKIESLEGKFMKYILMVFVACLSSEVVAASDEKPPFFSAALNCGLFKPPLESGVGGFHGKYTFVFPRHEEIPADYTGCQTMWIEDNQIKWVLYFEKGYLKAEHNMLDKQKLLCDYRKREAVDEKCGDSPTDASVERNTIKSHPLSRFPRAREKLEKLRELISVSSME